MKKILSLILCLMIVFSLFSFYAFAQQNVTSVYGQGNKIVRIDGNVDTKYGGKNVNILMVKKGENLRDNDISKIAHIGFTTVDSRGNYTYKFTTDCNLSDYCVLTKVDDNDIISSEISIMEESRLNIELNLSNKDKTAFSLSDTSQYELKAFVDNKLGNGKKVDLVSAFYDDSERLIKAEVKNNFEIPLDWDGANSVGTIFDKIPEDTDTIKLMVWENGNMKPLGNVSEYNFGKTEKKEFYVSANGNDLNDGTFERPLKTLNGAKNAVREYREAKGLPQNGITVYFRGGTYPITETVNFTEEDSGTKESPIVYKAWADEKVVFSGGLEIPGADFVKATDARIPENARNNVYCVNLKDYGITDFGGNNCGYYNVSNPIPGIEAFDNDVALVTARYPNVGENGIQQYLYAGSVDDNSASFVCRDDFLDSISDSEGGIIEGWFTTGYEYYGYDVEKIEKDNDFIYLKEDTYYKIKENNRYCISNLLEALDTKGEYYIDKNTGNFYVYSEDINSSKISLSVFGDNVEQAFIKTDDLSNVRFEDFCIELCRATGITVLGGENVVIKGCTVKNIGLRGIVIGSDGNARRYTSTCGLNVNDDYWFYNKDFRRAFNHKIENCEIYNTGKGAICVYGGDRKNLVPSNHKVTNCEFHDTARYQKSSPTAEIMGCGITVSNCEFYNSPFAGILLGGNEIIIEYNKFENLLNDCNDYGIIYSGIYEAGIKAGTEIRYNYFCDTPNKEYKKNDIDFEGTTMRVAVYNDHGNSFLEVHHNCFENVPIGMFNASGAENNWKNNVFKNVRIPMLIQWNDTLSSVLKTDDEKEINEKMFDSLSTKEYKKLNVSSGIWKEKYPKVSEVKENMIKKGYEATYPASTIKDNTCIFLNDESKTALSYLEQEPVWTNGKAKYIKTINNQNFYGYVNNVINIRHNTEQNQEKYLTFENNIYTKEDVFEKRLSDNGIVLNNIGKKQ